MKDILIVEKDPRTVINIKSVLNEINEDNYPINLHFVQNPSEALRYIKNHKPYLIITDIEFDQALDGICFVEEVNQLFPKDPTPVIYFSSQYNRELLQRARSTRMLNFIMKPSMSQKPESLRAAVELALVQLA